MSHIDVDENVKGTKCRFENVPIGLSSYKSNALRIWHY